MKAHPYAGAWPLLGDDDLAELADDIRANGLRDPIVTYDGLILDGRNRLAACAMAEVKPAFTEFEGDDDDALAFVQSVNNARRHQSKGSLAASWALSMLAADKRADGRWAYGESENSQNLTGRMRADLGLIADYSPDLLVEVRDGSLSLNAAHESAKAARDEHLRKQEDERLAAEAEAKAERFLRDSAPDLASLVGTTYETHLEAEAVWKVRNAEEAKARAEAERQERDRERAIERGIQDSLTDISNAIEFLAKTDPELFVAHDLPHRDRYRLESRCLTAEHVDSAIDYLTALRKAL